VGVISVGFVRTAENPLGRVEHNITCEERVTIAKVPEKKEGEGQYLKKLRGRF
jgi:hypothetical protein